MPILLFSLENDRIIYSNSKGKTFITTNNGHNWVNVKSESNRIIEFTNSEKKNYYSIDNGKSWIARLSEKSEIKFSIYPNPAADCITISFLDNNSSNRKVSIFSFANSEIVFANEILIDPNNKSFEISIKNLTEGKYLLIVETENRTCCEQFLKK